MLTSIGRVSRLLLPNEIPKSCCQGSRQCGVIAGVVAMDGIRPFLKRNFSEMPGRTKKDARFWKGLSTEEKRKHYACGRKFFTLDDLDTWEAYRQTRPANKTPTGEFEVNEVFNKKVTLWQGDITALEIGAIVNAANSSLLGGGGVDGAIHRAAGSSLRDECELLHGCDTGDAKITSGHRLPARHVIHTVGPIGRSAQMLESCYTRSLELVLKHELRSVAFPCISTGIFGYPNEPAAHTALGVVRHWLSNLESPDLVDRVIFCVFLPTDLEIYRRLLRVYFPTQLDGVIAALEKESSSDGSGDESETTRKHPRAESDGSENIPSRSPPKKRRSDPDSSVTAASPDATDSTDGKISEEGSGDKAGSPMDVDQAAQVSGVDAATEENQPAAANGETLPAATNDETSPAVATDEEISPAAAKDEKPADGEDNLFIPSLDRSISAPAAPANR